MPFKLTAACKTDVGQQREQNEDNAYAFVSEDGETGLFIVADGMGGYQAGEVASQIAVQRISEALKSFFVSVYDQPTVKLPPISEQETILLRPVKPDEQTTIRMDAVSTSNQSKAKTRKLPESMIAKTIEHQLKHDV